MPGLELLYTISVLYLPKPEPQLVGCRDLSVRVSSPWAATENLCQLSGPAHAAQLENLVFSRCATKTIVLIACSTSSLS